MNFAYLKKVCLSCFCTDEFNVPLARMVNSFVIEAVAGGNRVLIISPCPNVIVRNFLKNNCTKGSPKQHFLV